MLKYKTRQILTVAVVLIVIAIAIAALVSIARVMFFTNNSANNTQNNASQQSLIDTSANRAIVMSVRGPVVSNEKFKSYQVKISPSLRVLNVYSGYDNKVEKNVTLQNNKSAYEQLVFALNKANLMRGNELTGADNDTRGVCANGELYSFSILNADKSEKTLWTSTCGNAKGSLDGNLVTLRDLFIGQFPEDNSVIRNLF